MVAATGLVPLRGELRVARMGPFRSAVYFAAAGDPTRWSLDDGSWSASEARLTQAEPPPRRQPASAAAPRGPQSGVSLPAGTSWAGPRRGPAAAPSAVAPARQNLPQPADPNLAAPPQRPGLHGPADFPPLPPSAFQQPTAATNAVPRNLAAQFHRSQRKRGSAERASLSQPHAPAMTEAPTPALMSQLTALTSQVAQLLEEIRQLRREKYDLRMQVEAARGLHQHDPYPPPPCPAAGHPSGRNDDVAMLDNVTGVVRPRTPPHRPPASTVDLAVTSPTRLTSPDPKRVRNMAEVPFDDSIGTTISAAGGVEDDVL